MTQETSAVMAVSRQISLPGSGVSIPIVTGDSVADWVAESAEKPVSHATVSNKTMTPYKLAVIETFSMEFRRDLPARRLLEPRTLDQRDRQHQEGARREQHVVHTHQRVHCAAAVLCVRARLNITLDAAGQAVAYATFAQLGADRR